PVAIMSTRSASIRSGEYSRTGRATEAWSTASACTMTAGASALLDDPSPLVRQAMADESALGGGAIIIRQIGNQPGPRQRSRCLCSPGGRSGSYPTDELPNDHGPAD